MSGQEHNTFPRTMPSGPDRQIVRLYQEIRREKHPPREKLERFKNLVVNDPESWRFATQATEAHRRWLIEGIGCDELRPLLEAEEGILKRQFQYDASPAMEQVLIDHILTARVRLMYVEHRYSRSLDDGSFDFISAESWDGLLARAQKRFLRAVESLARVRKLARNTPAMQVNIATGGGQQMNLQI